MPKHLTTRYKFEVRCIPMGASETVKLPSHSQGESRTLAVARLREGYSDVSIYRLIDGEYQLDSDLTASAYARIGVNNKVFNMQVFIGLRKLADIAMLLSNHARTKTLSHEQKAELLQVLTETMQTIYHDDLASMGFDSPFKLSPPNSELPDVKLSDEISSDDELDLGDSPPTVHSLDELSKGVTRW